MRCTNVSVPAKLVDTAACGKMRAGKLTEECKHSFIPTAYEDAYSFATMKLLFLIYVQVSGCSGINPYDISLACTSNELADTSCYSMIKSVFVPSQTPFPPRITYVGA
ncbi:hypothetical protein BDQ17DRAFT_240439 [Cyathus striatus]|nr:hypothetical protein BDQ17DRAFT_240439 [Cyathus striatus]